MRPIRRPQAHSADRADSAPIAFRVAGLAANVFCRLFLDVRRFDFDFPLRGRTALVIANHRSLLDFVVALSLFHQVGRYPRAVTLPRYFKMPIVGHLLRSMRWICLDPVNTTGTVEQIHDLFNNGIPVVLMPEGRLGGVAGEPTSLLPFKQGAARIAADGDIPVWALALVGTDDVWPRTARWPRLSLFRRKLVVTVGADDERTMSGDSVLDTEMLESWVLSLLIEGVRIRDEIRADGVLAI